MSALFSVALLRYKAALAAAGGAGLVGGGGQVVPSIAALRTLLKTSASKNAFVTGYYAAGDGGGGPYWYDAADAVSIDNGGTVIVANDGGRWKLSQTNIVTFAQFGARGDNVTIDSEAMQRAVNNCLTLDTTNGAKYIININIVVPSGRTINNTAGAEFVWNGPSAQLSVGIFVNTGGSNIKFFNPIFRNISANLLVSGFYGISCQNITLTSPVAYGCKVGLFHSSASTFDEVVTSGVGANVCRNITVTDFIAIGAGPLSHGAAVDLFYCVDWRVEGGYSRDIQFGVQFWGGDANQNKNGALTNERKNRHGTVSSVNCANGMAGVWGSMGHGIKVLGCDVRVMSDVGIDFEGCEQAVAVGCHAEECKNGNYATFSYNTDVSFVSCTSRHTSEKPHYRNYNSSQTINNKSVRFIDITCITVGAIGTIDCGGGSVESIDVSDCTLTNTIINLTANNMRYVRVQNNKMLFSMAYGANFDAIVVGGVHSSGRVRIEGNDIISQVVQPSGSSGIKAKTDDPNSINRFELNKNNVSGFPQDITTENTGSNVGIAPVFNLTGNVLGAAVLNRVEQGAAKSKLLLVDNVSGDMAPWPNVIPTDGYWDKGTRIHLNAVAAGGFEGAICVTTGTPGTWKTCGAIAA